MRTADLAATIYGTSLSARRLKFALTSSATRAEFAPDDLVTFCPMEAVGDRGDLDTSESRRYEDVSSGFTRFVNGDVVVAKITPCFENGKGALVRELESHIGFGTTELHVLTPGDELDGRFLYYVTASSSFRGLGEEQMTGAAGQKRVPTDFVRDYPIWTPSIEDQRWIADYLDAETVEIDALIAEKRRMLTLLEEKRAALISHAVTRGLDPKARLKPSGLDWLGDVPAHWRIERLKFLLDGVDQGWSPQCDNFPADEGRWAVLKTGCVNRGIFREQENKALPDDVEPPDGIEVHAGDVLMSRASGSVELIGSVARVAQQPKARLLLSDKIFRLLPSSELLDADFLVAALGSSVLRHQIKAFISGAEGLANNIARTDISELILPVPPVAEQREIVLHLKRDHMYAGNLAGTLRSSIDLLTERRSALITAAVTGQLDVDTLKEEDAA